MRATARLHPSSSPAQRVVIGCNFVGLIHAGLCMLYRRPIFRYCLITLLGAMGRNNASAVPGGAPQPLRLQWGETYLRTEVEYYREQQSSGSYGSDFAYSQTRCLFVIKNFSIMMLLGFFI